LPIPRMLEFGKAFDGFYSISERARGAFIDALDARHMRRALTSLLAAIDGMRQADISTTRGFGLWDASGQAPHATWRDAWLAIGLDNQAYCAYRGEVRWPQLQAVAWRTLALSE